MSLGIRAWDQ